MCSSSFLGTGNRCPAVAKPFKSITSHQQSNPRRLGFRRVYLARSKKRFIHRLVVTVRDATGAWPALSVGWRRTVGFGDMFGARNEKSGPPGGDQLSSSPSWRYAPADPRNSRRAGAALFATAAA